MHLRGQSGRPARVRASELASIDDVAVAASACDLCRLRRDRSCVVVGRGPADAEVLVVSEAPGWHDDRAAELLAGPVRDVFDEVLALAGLTRDDVYLTSVVKCRPPTGRTPFPDEVEACEGWLFREIALVRPRVVVVLGTLALRLVTGRHDRIVDAHGALLHAQVQGRDLVVWPLYHPAAALHVPSLLAELHADARALGELLRGARTAARPRAIATTPSPAAVPPVPGSPEDPVDARDAAVDDDLDAGGGEPQLSLGI